MPTATQTSSANGVGSPAYTDSPMHSAEDSAIVPPTDRSMPRVMITKVWPSASTARMVDWMNRFLKFATVRKTGETTDMTAMKIRMTRRRPRRLTSVLI